MNVTFWQPEHGLPGFVRWPRGSGPRGGNCRLPWLRPGLKNGGQTGLAYQGSLIPNSALPQYLRGSNYGFIEVDWNKFAKDTNYQYFRDNISTRASATVRAAICAKS